MDYLQTYIMLCLVLGICIMSSETARQCGKGFQLYEHPSKPITMCCRKVDCLEGFTAHRCKVDNGNQTCVRGANEIISRHRPLVSTKEPLPVDTPKNSNRRTATQKPHGSTANRKTVRLLPILVVPLMCLLIISMLVDYGG